VTVAPVDHDDPRPQAAEGAGDAAQRLREQDKDGLDAEVLFPPVFASRFIEGIKDPEVYGAMIRAYNTFLAHDYCAVAPDRLIGNATMPITGASRSPPSSAPSGPGVVSSSASTPARAW